MKMFFIISGLALICSSFALNDLSVKRSDGCCRTKHKVSFLQLLMIFAICIKVLSVSQWVPTKFCTQSIWSDFSPAQTLEEKNDKTSEKGNSFE